MPACTPGGPPMVGSCAFSPTDRVAATPAAGSRPDLRGRVVEHLEGDEVQQHRAEDLVDPEPAHEQRGDPGPDGPGQDAGHERERDQHGGRQVGVDDADAGRRRGADQELALAADVEPADGERDREAERQQHQRHPLGQGLGEPEAGAERRRQDRAERLDRVVAESGDDDAARRRRRAPARGRRAAAGAGRGPGRGSRGSGVASAVGVGGRCGGGGHASSRTPAISRPRA